VPETLPAEHQHCGIENAGARSHLTILTKWNELSNNGFASWNLNRVVRQP
jgi:hypothetical protein